MSARRDFVVSLASQGVVVLAGFVRALLIPYLFAGDIGGYAAWQTYVLYAGLVSFLLLGLNDGYMLRFREAKNGLSWTGRSSALRMSWLFSVVEYIALYVILILVTDPAHPWLWAAVLANVPLLAVSGTCLYFLQMTLRFPQASWMVVAERLGFVVLMAALAWGDSFTSLALILSDIGVRLVATVTVVATHGREMLRGGFSLPVGIRESLGWVRQGFPVMVGSYVVVLSASLVRLLVERTGSAVDFANYALGFSITNVLLVLGRALGNVLFPHLAGAPRELLSRHLRGLDRLMAYAFPLGLVCYFPMAWLLRSFLPRYADAPTYLAPLLVVVGVQVIISSLNNPFYKLLRLERHLLGDNVAALALMLVCTYVLRGNIMLMTVAQAAVMMGLAWWSRMRFRRVLDERSTPGVLIVFVWAVAFGVVLTTLGPTHSALVFPLGVALFLGSRFKEVSALLKSYGGRGSQTGG